MPHASVPVSGRADKGGACDLWGAIACSEVVPIALLLELIQGTVTRFAPDSALSRSLRPAIGMPMSHQKLECIRTRLLSAALARYAVCLPRHHRDVEHAQLVLQDFAQSGYSTPHVDRLSSTRGYDQP